eukprot:10281683-Lingulodinium_polyedra.AAC.1
MCGAAAMECMSERISEQFACESCSGMRSDVCWLLQRRAIRNPRVPCVDRHVVVDAWSARVQKCVAP